MMCLCAAAAAARRPVAAQGEDCCPDNRKRPAQAVQDGAGGSKRAAAGAVLRLHSLTCPALQFALSIANVRSTLTCVAPLMSCRAVSCCLPAASQAGRSHMKQLMSDLEVEQEKCAGLAAALDGEVVGSKWSCRLNAPSGATCV